MESDALGREHVAQFLAANDAENISLGIELDVRYDNSPVVVSDGSAAPPWDRRAFVPTVRPGHRAPNVMLGEQDTLFDQFGPGFTLVDALGDSDQSRQLVSEAVRISLPIRHLALTDPVLRVSISTGWRWCARTCTSPGVAPTSPTPRTSSIACAARTQPKSMRNKEKRHQ
jgi:hypothetical protein